MPHICTVNECKLSSMECTAVRMFDTRAIAAVDSPGAMPVMQSLWESLLHNGCTNQEALCCNADQLYPGKVPASISGGRLDELSVSHCHSEAAVPSGQPFGAWNLLDAPA